MQREGYDSVKRRGYDRKVIPLSILALCLSCAPPEEDLELELRMAELINVDREARGIAPLALSMELSEVARRHSVRMAEARKADHGLGPPLEDRILAVRPDVCTFGENVSRHTSIDYSLADLMQSKGHRANLLSAQFTEIGIGIVRGGDGYLYITQNFIRPCEKRAPKR
jgi:uncharacterized protein YkwD